MTAHLARIVDNDGRISVRRIARTGKLAPEYRAVLRVRCPDRVATELQTAYGGSITHELTAQGHPRESALYEVTGPKLALALQDLRTGLRRLQPLADVAIALLDVRASSVAQRVPVADGAVAKRQSDDYLAACEALYRRALALTSALPRRG